MILNEIRFYHYISGVLVSQQADPLCRVCKAFSNSVVTMREGITELEGSGAIDGLPEELKLLLEESRDRIFAIETLDNATGQKKTGNCKMPEGVCFVKTSKAILTRIKESPAP